MQLKPLRMVTASALVVCSILSIVFGIELIVITSEISSFGGTTVLIGKVIDGKGDALANVSVWSGDTFVSTDRSGLFRLEDMDQGKCDLHLYKDAYVGLDTSILLYPTERRWLGDHAIGANDLSDDPFVLYDEIEWNDVQDVEGVTIEDRRANTEGGNVTLQVRVRYPGVKEPVSITVFYENVTETRRTFLPGQDIILREDLNPGRYDIMISGMDILDRGIMDLDLSNGSLTVNVTGEPQSFVLVASTQKVEGNFILGVAYIIIGASSIVGAYLSVRTDRWGLLVITTIIAFFGRGPLDILGMNLVPFFALLSLFAAIALRGEMSRGRRRFKPRHDEMT